MVVISVILMTSMFDLGERIGKEKLDAGHS